MKLLIADGKVAAVERGCRGLRSSRGGPKGTRDAYAIVSHVPSSCASSSSTHTPAPQSHRYEVPSADGHLFGEDDGSEDEDEEEPLVSCLPLLLCPCHVPVLTPASPLIHTDSTEAA